MAPSIYVTRALPQPVMDKLTDAGFDYEVYEEDRVIPHEVLLENVKNRDGILCILTDKINKEVFDNANQAKIFANYAVGYNNIDVEEATRRKIAITNTPGVLTETTADLAWALILVTARRMGESERFLRAGKFKGWGPQILLGQDIYGSTLGIIGLGRIGKAVARRAPAFNMKVIYYSNQRDPIFEDAFLGEIEFAPMDTLLEKSDVVSIHVPLKDETKHLIGEEELRQMPDHAILINTARGPIVDEAALVKALKEKWIWAAGLDVFEEEPKVHPGLLELENVVLLPHIGSATIQTRTKMGLIAVDNLIAFFDNKKPPNLVNEEIWT